MENKNIEILKEIEDIGFPEDSDQIIDEVLKEYGLKKSQEEGVNNFIKSVESGITSGRSEIFNNLPGTKISKIVRDCAEGKIAREKLPNSLKENLGISGKEAQKLANDIENKIIKRIRIIEKTPATPPPQEEVLKIKRKDVYREPII